MTIGYIYLLRVREFIKTGEHVYKIGKTKQEFPARFNQYPDGTELYLMVKVKGIDLFEKQIIDLYNKLFKRREGNEYFEGDPIEMMNLIFYYFNINNNKTDEQILQEQEQIMKAEDKKDEKEEKKQKEKLEKERLKEEKKQKEKIEKERLKQEKEKERLEKLEKQRLEKLEKEKEEKLRQSYKCIYKFIEERIIKVDFNRDGVSKSTLNNVFKYWFQINNCGWFQINNCYYEKIKISKLSELLLNTITTKFGFKTTKTNKWYNFKIKDEFDEYESEDNLDEIEKNEDEIEYNIENRDNIEIDNC